MHSDHKMNRNGDRNLKEMGLRLNRVLQLQVEVGTRISPMDF